MKDFVIDFPESMPIESDDCGRAVGKIPRWQLDRDSCLGLLERLVSEGTLHRRSDGAYCAFPAIRPKPLKVVRSADDSVRRHA